jgi:uncharacterized cupredoxin-like copper-binding protein
MSNTTVTEDTAAEDTGTDQPAAADGESPMLFGAGQAAWLTGVTLLAVIALVLAVVALVRSNSEGSGGGGAAAAPTNEVTVVAKEFSFAPKRVLVKADTDVSVTLDNEGAVEHEWVVLKAGTKIAKEADFKQDMVAVGTKRLAGGANETINLNLAAGSYQVVCMVTGHFANGMQGELVVQ